MDNEALLLPSYLRSLGYENSEQVQELSSRALERRPDAIYLHPPWSHWRGIFEYICCVEYARWALRSLPAGRAISSADALAAQYHSASLVFFAQATLDNIAEWTGRCLLLKCSGSDRAFHKKRFKRELATNAPSLVSSVEKHENLIFKVERYRQAWIHRLSGGARVCGDAAADNPNANPAIMVPLNPDLSPDSGNPRTYIKALARTRTNNKGEWLCPVGTFADEITDGLRNFVMDFLTEVLADQSFLAKYRGVS